MHNSLSSLSSDLSVGRLGKAGGFAPLGLDNKVPSINLPTGLAGGLSLQGGYDASTNTPDLTAGAQQSDGALYIVTVAGTQDIGNGSELFTVGDTVFYSSGDARWFLLQGSTLAIEVAYNNGTSGLTATSIQGAIDEIDSTQDGVLGSTSIFSLPAYDDDAAAAAGVGGLTTGQIYQTTGSGAAPLNAAGIVMIKQ